MMNIKYKLKKGLALTVKESWEAYDYIEMLEAQSKDVDEAEWIEVDPLGTGDKAYMCSKCETGDWSVTIHEYQYCPYCGRRMKNGGVEHVFRDE